VSINAMNWAWAQDAWTPERKLLLLALARCAGPYDECTPSLMQLASDTGLSHAVVRSSLAALEAMGLIRHEPRAGRVPKFILQSDFARACAARKALAIEAAP
jgi:DNA-binding transcriptional MocR family regulator